MGERKGDNQQINIGQSNINPLWLVPEDKQPDVMKSFMESDLSVRRFRRACLPIILTGGAIATVIILNWDKIQQHFK